VQLTSLPNLLTLYALATGVYSLSVVMIAYEMSYKIANTSWVQLAFSGALVVGICLFHTSLHQVIWVQMIVMACLTVVVSAPFLLSPFRSLESTHPVGTLEGLRILRRVSEDEVITAFLKNDVYHPEFEEYREVSQSLLADPDFHDADQNAKRRALLFIRHDALWRELPRSTEWVEVEIPVADLGRIRVFPRAQWRKLARGGAGIAGASAWGAASPRASRSGTRSA
jgi:hypothetical protein